MNIAADYLSGGEQQMAAVARALSAEILKSEPYLSRLNCPTPMTRFYRAGDMRGVWVTRLVPLQTAPTIE